MSQKRPIDFDYGTGVLNAMPPFSRHRFSSNYIKISLDRFVEGRIGVFLLGVEWYRVVLSSMENTDITYGIIGELDFGFPKTSDPF